ncbi:MAG: hypothetical protein WAQ98_32060 [Blastocatellia bacterium]
MKKFSSYLVLFILVLIINLANITNVFADSRKVSIKEISVFKDGHVFVLHEENLPTDSNGNVLLDYIPNPILGTFWPFSADPNAKLVGVSTGIRKIAVERTALSFESLIAANIGSEVLITEKGVGDKEPIQYQATILSIPTRTSEELAATSSVNSPEQLAQKSGLVLLKTNNGVKILAISQIQDITFKNSFNTKLTEEELRTQMTLKLDWGKQKLAPSAKVGLVYVQKGIRWIPSYRINLDGNGNATVKLQATLLNELADLNDVSVNLVVGVPTFVFANSLDPMALQQSIVQLSNYFDNNRRDGYSNAIRSNNFSIDGADNNITSQRIITNQSTSSDTQAGDLGPDFANSAQSEDLFVFKLKNISLKRGERMVVTLAEQTFKYKDVYVVDLPFSPPSELSRNISSQQQLELARLMKTPKATHKIRITNNGTHPFTTAPALITSNDAVLAEGLLTYTSIGATTDLEITKAINILAKKTETESKRTPNAVRWNGDDYSRSDIASSVSLTNLYKQPVYLEITRYVLGNVDNASNTGEIKAINVLEDDSFLGLSGYNNYSYNWPSWWNRFNGVGKISWKTTLEPGKNITFDYNWHYFWR